MVRIEFRVDEKPPKKIRGKSLWTAESQSKLVRELRRVAFAKRKSMGIEVLDGEISLEIKIFVSEINNEPNRPESFVGDLDNLISGICESLQKAHYLYTYGDDPAGGKPIIYMDDNQIISIKAIKEMIPKGDVYYEIVIEGKNE